MGVNDGEGMFGSILTGQSDKKMGMEWGGRLVRGDL
jgi:hypothetical protein